MDDFSKSDEELGRGSYKVVWRARQLSTGGDVAWVENIGSAILDDPMTGAGDPAEVLDPYQTILNEAQFMAKLNHRYILGLIAQFPLEDRIHVLITECLTSGTLAEFVDSRTSITLGDLKRWARQLLEGLAYMHDQGVMHRDFKSSNVMLRDKEASEVVIMDFGSATDLIDDRAAGTVGTLNYMAPEVMLCDSYGPKADIYSLGMTLLEMVSREVPYAECEVCYQVIHKVHSGTPPRAMTGVLHPGLQEFIRACVNVDIDSAAVESNEVGETHSDGARSAGAIITTEDQATLAGVLLRSPSNTISVVPEHSQGNGSPPILAITPASVTTPVVQEGQGMGLSPAALATLSSDATTPADPSDDTATTPYSQMRRTVNRSASARRVAVVTTGPVSAGDCEYTPKQSVTLVDTRGHTPADRSNPRAFNADVMARDRLSALEALEHGFLKPSADDDMPLMRCFNFERLGSSMSQELAGGSTMSDDERVSPRSVVQVTTTTSNVRIHSTDADGDGTTDLTTAQDPPGATDGPPTVVVPQHAQDGMVSPMSASTDSRPPRPLTTPVGHSHRSYRSAVLSARHLPMDAAAGGGLRRVASGRAAPGEMPSARTPANTTSGTRTPLAQDAQGTMGETGAGCRLNAVHSSSGSIDGGESPCSVEPTVPETPVPTPGPDVTSVAHNSNNRSWDSSTSGEPTAQGEPDGAKQGVAKAQVATPETNDGEDSNPARGVDRLPPDRRGALAPRSIRSRRISAGVVIPAQVQIRYTCSADPVASGASTSPSSTNVTTEHTIDAAVDLEGVPVVGEDAAAMHPPSFTLELRDAVRQLCVAAQRCPGLGHLTISIAQPVPGSAADGDNAVPPLAVDVGHESSANGQSPHPSNADVLDSPDGTTSGAHDWIPLQPITPHTAMEGSQTGTSPQRRPRGNSGREDTVLEIPMSVALPADRSVQQPGESPGGVGGANEASRGGTGRGNGGGGGSGGAAGGESAVQNALDKLQGAIAALQGVPAANPLAAAVISTSPASRDQAIPIVIRVPAPSDTPPREALLPPPPAEELTPIPAMDHLGHDPAAYDPMGMNMPMPMPLGMGIGIGMGAPLGVGMGAPIGMGGVPPPLSMNLDMGMGGREPHGAAPPFATVGPPLDAVEPSQQPAAQRMAARPPRAKRTPNSAMSTSPTKAAPASGKSRTVTSTGAGAPTVNAGARRQVAPLSAAPLDSVIVDMEDRDPSPPPHELPSSAVVTPGASPATMRLLPPVAVPHTPEAPTNRLPTLSTVTDKSDDDSDSEGRSTAISAPLATPPLMGVVASTKPRRQQPPSIGGTRRPKTQPNGTDHPVSSQPATVAVAATTAEASSRAKPQDSGSSDSKVITTTEPHQPSRPRGGGQGEAPRRSSLSSETTVATDPVPVVTAERMKSVRKQQASRAAQSAGQSQSQSQPQLQSQSQSQPQSQSQAPTGTAPSTADSSAGVKSPTAKTPRKSQSLEAMAGLARDGSNEPRTPRAAADEAAGPTRRRSASAVTSKAPNYASPVRSRRHSKSPHTSRSPSTGTGSPHRTGPSGPSTPSDSDRGSADKQVVGSRASTPGSSTKRTPGAATRSKPVLVESGASLSMSGPPGSVTKATASKLPQRSITTPTQPTSGFSASANEAAPGANSPGGVPNLQDRPNSRNSVQSVSSLAGRASMRTGSATGPSGPPMHRSDSRESLASGSARMQFGSQNGFGPMLGTGGSVGGGAGSMTSLSPRQAMAPGKVGGGASAAIGSAGGSFQDLGRTQSAPVDKPVKLLQAQLGELYHSGPSTCSNGAVGATGHVPRMASVPSGGPMPMASGSGGKQPVMRAPPAPMASGVMILAHFASSGFGFAMGTDAHGIVQMPVGGQQSMPFLQQQQPSQQQQASQQQHPYVQSPAHAAHGFDRW